MNIRTLFFLLFLSCAGWSQQPDPLCPVPGGLRGPARDARIQWFLARHPDLTHTAGLWQRGRIYLGGQHWKGVTLLTTPPNPDLAQSYLSQLPEVAGEQWLELRAFNPQSSQEQEVYTYRDGGSDDQLEWVETLPSEGWYSTRIWVAPGSRRSQLPLYGPDQAEPGWQELAIPPVYREEARSPQNTWSQAESKLKNYPPYKLAVQAGLAIAGVKFLELGSNNWPVVPMGLFEEDPRAEFYTLDINYPGLWLMEEVLRQLRPEWNVRVHRFLCDYTAAYPLADNSIDVTCSSAAFGPSNLDAPACWAGFLEIARVLKPGGRLFADMQAFERRPAWLTWAVLQRFELEADWGGRDARTLVWRKRR